MKMSKLEATVEISRALANPARLRIVAMLGDNELCVCQITEVLELAQSTVSGHLRELRRAGLVTERKAGRWVYFGLASDSEARRWLDAVAASARGDGVLERDGVKVEEIRRLPVEDLCRLGYEAAKAKVSADALIGE
jgi:DNA-binding transcriptional ArsR family regulator